MNFETWCMMEWEQRNGMIGWSDCVREWENEMGYQMEKITVLSLGAGYQGHERRERWTNHQPRPLSGF